jgi:putative DNA-invertase from lambdoid prophage Rac
MIAAIYARVSTVHQDHAMQLVELRDYCRRMEWPHIEYVETASGKAGSKRPVLKKLMADARMKRFGAVVVWKIDRFGRSLRDLIGNVMELDAAGVRFVAPSQGIDTDKRSPFTKMLLHLMALFAGFERDLIVERVKAGVAEAKRHGKHCGRPRRIFRRDEAARLRESGMTWRAIARKLRVPQATIRLALRGVQKV